MKNEFEIRENTLVVFIESKGETHEAYFDIDDLPALLELDRKFFLHSQGYVCYSYKGKMLLAHKLIVPYELVDHINENRLDNRKGNLRKSNKTLNALNTSKVKGVRYLKGRKKPFQARYIVNGKTFQKFFETEAEAIEWRRKEIEKRLG
jgi:hypothetical protein